MPKRKHPKPQRPDDVIEWGPIRIAKYGRHIVSQSNWPEGEFEKYQKKLVDHFPQVVAEIDKVIAEIAELVCSLPAEKVLHRAWGEMSVKHLRISSEVEVGVEEGNAMRMVDYLQSVIASHPRSEAQHDSISEAQWATLGGLVGKLFQKLNSEYPICNTAKHRAENKDLELDFEEYSFRAQMLWVNVKGHRYQAHERAWLPILTIYNPILACRLKPKSFAQCANQKAWLVELK